MFKMPYSAMPFYENMSAISKILVYQCNIDLINVFIKAEHTNFERASILENHKVQPHHTMMTDSLLHAGGHVSFITSFHVAVCI